ncbi:hypothetical protein [Aureimonas jatrophae]|uniref:Uncharacterized protein n=1 Tax=Aureimonas jatrophae TaxID=1166073 RepID=A0A1H0K0F8_9HYPH|nr:hypothetical protein [Aureimonas jatrophae]MBB3950885.1 hypothetical protein [Aureimonas jatrophae]SDO49299.1 hypothetical protein SAMN05192530_10731 [Aureimonas jatrophae]
MRPRTAAKKTARYTLLAASLVLLFGLGFLFLQDLGRGREARQIETIQNAQERGRQVTPAPVPAAPPP